MSKGRVLLPRIERETVRHCIRTTPAEQASQILNREQPELIAYISSMIDDVEPVEREPVRWMMTGAALAYLALKEQMEKGE